MQANDCGSRTPDKGIIRTRSHGSTTHPHVSQIASSMHSPARTSKLSLTCSRSFQASISPRSTHFPHRRHCAPHPCQRLIGIGHLLDGGVEWTEFYIIIPTMPRHGVLFVHNGTPTVKRAILSWP